jgi:hypothetical protein
VRGKINHSHRNQKSFLEVQRVFRWRFLFISVILSFAVGVSTKKAFAAAPAQPLPTDASQSQSSLVDDGVVCVSQLVWRQPELCFPYGPGTTAVRVANIRLPEPLPELSVVPLPAPEASVTPFTYAQVVQDYAPVYNHPIEAAQGLPPKRRLGVGFIWVSVQGTTNYEGRAYYQINQDEYVPIEALSLYRPSAFQGVALAAQPERPFAWILRSVQPTLTPGGEVNADAPVYQRYQLVQIFATERHGEQVWYLIAPDQWINQVYVAKVTPAATHGGVASEGAWVEINLFEQTLAAYVGDRMVYATLVSSGLPGWNTPTGLFQVWHRVTVGKMSGAEGRADYYFLEDVPWTLYFNQDVALHGAYWHNSFGYQHSHGCVNLAPLDARWLFEWAPDGLVVRVQSGQDLIANQ